MDTERDSQKAGGRDGGGELMAATETAAHIDAIETYLFFRGASLGKRTIARYAAELRRAKAHLMAITAPLAADESMTTDELLAALTA